MAKPHLRRTLGDFGERLARQHLLADGYEVLEANYQIPEGEIDLIARKDGTLVFVEVRTRRGYTMGTPLESVTLRKQTRLLTAVRTYLQRYGDHPPDHRIDVIAISLEPEGRSAGRLVGVEHIESAVDDQLD